jgi:tetratricopeptide (TPR) repeat protein
MADHDQFQELMSQGADAAWHQDWQTALEIYSQAVQIDTEDAEANIGLGIALQNTGRLDRALQVFNRATKLAPNDPVPIERSAEVLEGLGQPDDSAQRYVKVGDAYAKVRDVAMAINSWEKAASLTRGLISVHAKLAQAYEKIGDKSQVIRQYALLARSFQMADDEAKAKKALERILRIDRNNAVALNGLRALNSGLEINIPQEYYHVDAEVEAPTGDGDLFSYDPYAEDDERLDVGVAHPLGPIGEALERSLEIMAAFVVESGLNEFVMFAMQGMEYQRQDDELEAIAAYEQAVAAGLRHPSLQMALGGLLVLNDRSQDAIAYLGEAAQSSELQSGAFHGLGLAYYAMENQPRASKYLIQSLRNVDVQLSKADNELDDLTPVYDSLLSGIQDRAPEMLEVINGRFIKLLSGEDWKQRIPETRRHLVETLRGEGQGGLFDWFIAKGSDELTELVTSIDRFIRQGLYTLAMEIAHFAVERSPSYLPVHVRMAEIMMKEGRIRQAINKYNTVARSYLVREENDRAASILGEVLEMAPLDVDVRWNLIELLESEDRWQEALDQHMDLAQTYQQLGDFDNAMYSYDRAEEIGQDLDVTSDKRAQIKHAIADIHQLRLNTREAQRIYEEIITFAPQDEPALRALIDIYYTQGNQGEAVRKLDTLLSTYAKSGRVNKIVELLEQLVHRNPDDAALRKRLASIYRRRNQKAEAIEQLDALGELQLDAGLTQEAAQTIKQIIALKPDRVDEYKRLLQQLRG